MTLFEYIKQHTDILEVVRHYVHLRMAGTYYKGKCPFHRENDASFTVSPDKGIYYCFGCQATGDAIGFIEKVEQKSPREASEMLIERYHLTVPSDILRQMHQSEESVAQKKSYYAVCQFVARWTHEQLLNDQYAFAYVESRGLTRETITQFSLGYLPGTKSAIQKFLKDASRNGILLKDLISSNIFFESKTSLRSPYEERILFPIIDGVGRYCGFGGRIFKPNDTRAKYYNSKESPFFFKGKLLFGLSQAKEYIAKEKTVFLVEGYMDYLALAQHGHRNVVATLGTACTREHLLLLARYAHTINVLFDGDSAGLKAVLRMLELCWDVNLELKVVLLPQGSDPASWLQSGNTLGDIVAQSTDIFTFMVHQQTKNFGEEPLGYQLQSVHAILSVIARVTDPIKQELLLLKTSGATKISFDALRKHLLQRHQEKPHEIEEQEKAGEVYSVEDTIIAALVNDVSEKSRLTIPDDVVDLLNQNVQKIAKKRIDFLLSNEKNTFDSFLLQLTQEEREYVMPLVMKYHESLTQQSFDVLLQKFLHSNWKHIVHKMKAAIADASTKNDQAKVAELMKHFSQLKQRIHEKGLV